MLNKVGLPLHIIHSKEDVDQGCTFSMNLCEIGIMPQLRQMLMAVPEAIQPWCADDGSSVGRACSNAVCLYFLTIVGPRYSYFVEQPKSYQVCKAEDKTVAWKEFESHGLLITTAVTASTSADSSAAEPRRSNDWRRRSRHKLELSRSWRRSQTN